LSSTQQIASSALTRRQAEKATGSSELSQKQWKKPGGGKCPDEQDKTLSRVDVIEVSVAAASAQHMGATPTIHKAGREISGMSLLSYT